MAEPWGVFLSPLLNTLTRIPQWFLPKDPNRSELETRRLYLLVTLCIMLSPFCMGTIVGYGTFAPIPVTATVVLSWLASILIPLWVRKGGSADASSLLIGAGMAVTSTVFAWYANGVHSSAFCWILVVPLTSTAISGRRQGILLAGVSTLCTTTLIVGQQLSLLPESFLSEPLTMLGYQLTAICLPLVMFISVTVAHTIREVAVDKLGIANITLKAEIQRHKATRLELERLQSGLVDTARAAGMADVATNVLHNLGNALNSVRVSIGIAEERTRIRYLDLTQASGALRTLTNPPADLARLATLADYLDAAQDRFQRERDRLSDELFRIRQGVEQIEAVVRAQQVLAGEIAIVERLSVSDLVDQALLLAQGHARPASVQFAATASERRISIDRHRVLQILVNLVHNACDASANKMNPRVAIVATTTETQLQVTVTDNGIGITPSDQERIFTNGYTTKPNHLGFGLHTSAQATKSLAGSLTVSSDGVGKGATFTLRIPIGRN